MFIVASVIVRRFIFENKQMNNLVAGYTQMKKKSEFWQTFMVFVWVVLGGRDHNTGIKVMSLPVLS